jgi:hypothetical protein
VAAALRWWERNAGNSKHDCGVLGQQPENGQHFMGGSSYPATITAPTTVTVTTTVAAGCRMRSIDFSSRLGL